MRRKVGQISFKHEQLSRDIATVQTTEQNVSEKVSSLTQPAASLTQSAPALPRPAPARIQRTKKAAGPPHVDGEDDMPPTHPLTGRELRELRRRKRDSPISSRFLSYRSAAPRQICASSHTPPAWLALGRFRREEGATSHVGLGNTKHEGRVSVGRQRFDGPSRSWRCQYHELCPFTRSTMGS
jgi:hypothetical protein